MIARVCSAAALRSLGRIGQILTRDNIRNRTTYFQKQNIGFYGATK